MRLRPLLLAFIVAMCAAPLGFATAGEEKHKGGKEDPKALLQYDMSPVAIPVFYRSAVVNYVFVKIRFVTGKPGDSAVVKAKEPYLRDALVRAASHTVYNSDTDLNRIDPGPIQKLMAASAETFIGKGVVKQVLVIDQIPQKPLPRPNS
jgi:hypothetical protein